MPTVTSNVELMQLVLRNQWRQVLKAAHVVLPRCNKTIGVHECIQKHFLKKNYSWAKLGRVVQQHRVTSAATVNALTSTASSIVQPTEKKLKGRAGGRVLDQAVNDCIEGRVPVHTKKYPVTEKELSQLNQHSQYFVLPQVCAEKVMPTARRYLISMLSRGYVPIRSQLPVSCQKLGLQTAIDQIWLDIHTQKIVVVEMKINKTLYHRLSCGVLAKPLEAQTNSLCNQAHLQLGLSCYMLQNVHQVRIGSALVTRVDGTNIEITPMLQWVSDSMPDILHTIRVGATKKSKTKTRV